MKLPINGPSYQHSSIDVNNQRCINMFPTSAGPEGRGESVLIPTTGLLLLTDLGNKPIRSMATVGQYTYVVAQSSVYRLSINYATLAVTSTLLGTINTTSGTVYVASNFTQIIWVDGSDGFIYNTDTAVFSQITDVDFPTATQVKFLDNYFIVNDAGTSTFYFSSLANGLTWDALDVATAESGTDDVVGLGVSKGELWVFGETTTEIWYNAANPTGAPFSARDGLELQIGCGAPDSIAEMDDLLIWLDNRGFIVQSAVSPFIRSNNSGYDLKIISDEAITEEILSYVRRDDAISCTYNDRGHLMYQITFPTAEKTWVFDYTTKAWHQRSFFNETINADEHHLGQFAADSNSLHLMAGSRDGKIYISSNLYYDDNDVPIKRIRSTPVSYDPELYKLIAIDSLELRMETGRAAQGLTPHISMKYSHDGGHTWSFDLVREIGQVGEYAKPIRWNRLGIGREWMFEFQITDAIPFSIIDATVAYSDTEI